MQIPLAKLLGVCDTTSGMRAEPTNLVQSKNGSDNNRSLSGRQAKPAPNQSLAQQYICRLSPKMLCSPEHSLIELLQPGVCKNEGIFTYRVRFPSHRTVSNMPVCKHSTRKVDIESELLFVSVLSLPSWHGIDRGLRNETKPKEFTMMV